MYNFLARHGKPLAFLGVRSCSQIINRQILVNKLWIRRVLTWFVSRWRNHQLKRAEKPHSIIQPARKNGLLDGPATRPMTPLAVENGVGKLAAPLWWRA